MLICFDCFIALIFCVTLLHCTSILYYVSHCFIALVFNILCSLAGLHIHFLYYRLNYRLNFASLHQAAVWPCLMAHICASHCICAISHSPFFHFGTVQQIWSTADCFYNILTLDKELCKGSKPGAPIRSRIRDLVPNGTKVQKRSQKSPYFASKSQISV